MDKRFKPVLAAAVAAGLFPGISHIGPSNNAYGAVIADFTFESATSGTGSGLSTQTLLAESGLATFSFVKATSLGGMSTINGNGSAQGVTLTRLNQGSLTFKFSIDNATNIAFSFDISGSNTAPRDFVVEYSLDGTNFSTFAGDTFSIASSSSLSNSTGGPATGSGTDFVGTATSFAALNHLFNLPTSFSDSDLGNSGQFGFLQLLVADSTGISGGSIGTTGGTHIDNVVILTPEPASTALVMTLAGAMVAMKRRRSNV